MENFRRKMTKPIIGLPLLYYFADEMMITTADNTVSFLNFLVLKIFGIYCSNYRKVESCYVLEWMGLNSYFTAKNERGNDKIA